MKSKKILSLFAAAAVLNSSFALSAYAVDLELAPDYAASIKITDEDGKPLAGAVAQVKAQDGSVVARWTVGSEEKAEIYDTSVGTSESYVQAVPVSGLNLNEDRYMSDAYCWEKEEEIRHEVLNWSGEDVETIYIEDAMENCDYEFEAVEDIRTKDDFKVPAGQYAMIVDSEYADKIFSPSVSLKSGDKIYEKSVIENAGKTEYYNDAAVGEYECNLNFTTPIMEADPLIGKISISDKESVYTKVKISMEELCPPAVEDDGTYKVSQWVIDFCNDPEGVTSAIAIVSGSVITLAVPDADGNV